MSMKPADAVSIRLSPSAIRRLSPFSISQAQRVPSTAAASSTPLTAAAQWWSTTAPPKDSPPRPSPSRAHCQAITAAAPR